MFTRCIQLLIIASAGSITLAQPLNEPNVIPVAYISSDSSSEWQHQPSMPKSADPHETITDITSRSGEWTEPSEKSEVQYITAIRNWLNTLPRDKQGKARRILQDVHPTMHYLRDAIRDKKAQLASLTYGKDTTPETLPRLGLQLQQLRAALREELGRLKVRLAREAHVDMGPLGKDTFWMSLPPHKTH